MARVRRPVFVVAALVLLAALFNSAVWAQEGPSQNRGPANDRVQVIIGYFDDPDEIDVEDIEELGGEIRYTYDIIPAIAALIPASALDELEDDADVERVEADHLVYADPAVTPNDPRFPDLWGLHNTGQTGGTPDADIDTPEAWDITTGSPTVTVAVTDTGVQVAPGFSGNVETHPDLAANLWVNPGEVAGNGVDDDGNGYVDDVHGWNFYDNAAWLFYSSSEDDHGTHVAGTIAAVGNNGIGVTGVSWQARLMVLKFIGPSGGYTSDAIAAVEYATNKGAHVINASWGGGGFSQALKNAIEACGCVFAAAAGNSGVNTDTSPHYPSSYSSANLVSVAATDHNDGLASFSNYGAASVDLGAPGVSILSTLPMSTYGHFSGTSMATPHVSGVASLVYAQSPALTPLQVKDRILDAVDLIAALGGITVTGGRLNAANALLPPDTTPPAAPTGLTATAGDGSVSLDWADNSETDLAGYNVKRSTVAGGPYTQIASGVGISGYTDNSVNNGTTYYYVVSAVDTSDNESGTSNEASATPLDTTPPAAPTGLVATAGDGTVSLDWTDNAEPDLASYNVNRSVVAGGPYTQVATGGGVSSYTDTGLINGTTYYYVVTAVDTAGNESANSNETSATPQAPDTTPPAAPTGLAATAGDGTVSLDWADNAEPDLASYDVRRSTVAGGPYTQIASGVAVSAYADNAVTNGTTYYYVVTAVDTSGNESSASNQASATPLDTTPPTAPTGLVATAGDGSVSLDWADNTEPDLSSYNVKRSTAAGGPYTQIAAGIGVSAYTDTGLTNGTTYYYVVTAVDTADNESGASNEASATPVAPPAEQVLEQNLSGGDKMDIKEGQKGAQSFKHGVAGDPDYQITKIVLRLSRDKAKPNGDLTVSIGTGVNAGTIAGSLVAINSSDVTNTSEGDSFMTYEVTYSTPVGPLTAGTNYYLNFENEAPNGKAFYLEYAGDNTYANGTYYKAGSDDEKDAWFQVWGGPAGPSTTSEQISRSARYQLIGLSRRGNAAHALRTASRGRDSKAG